MNVGRAKAEAFAQMQEIGDKSDAFSGRAFSRWQPASYSSIISMLGLAKDKRISAVFVPIADGKRGLFDYRGCNYLGFLPLSTSWALRGVAPRSSVRQKRRHCR